MNRMFILVVAVLALIGPMVAAAEPSERSSTVADRQRVNLTVYNGGTALVHDRRRIELTDGLNRIAWRDVSAQMDATSALVDGPVSVLEQNFNYDLLNPSALLQRYVGRQVTVVHEARFAGEHDTRETARILSTNNGIVLQYRDRIETELRGRIVFPASPKNFRDRPTLDLDIESAHAGAQTLDLSYLTSGLSWRVDYVGVLGPSGKSLALNGLVTLSNASGVDYDDAHLQLVAGNVNIVEPRGAGALKEIARVTTADAYSVNAVRQENYFEYHLYTLTRTTSIANLQTKQVSLLSARNVPVRETLELRGSPYYYRNQNPDLGERLPVGAYVTFENRGGELGIPLPAGIVRMYKNDSQGLSQFLGSDNIDHTPRNEIVRLHLGDSFDVTARKRQTDFRFSSPCSTDSSYEIVLGNAKASAASVLVVEPIPAQWEITSESQSHAKSSASTATWNVYVPANGHATLTYTARVTWCSAQ
jgi:hypothetical protein